MKRLIVIVLLVVALAPPPPLLPAKPGPATLSQYRATCSRTYYRTTYPRLCARVWRQW